jgi:hypothetical protein
VRRVTSGDAILKNIVVDFSGKWFAHNFPGREIGRTSVRPKGEIPWMYFVKIDPAAGDT